MPSSPTFIDFITGQFSNECQISYRKMFGEYAIYSKGKVVALVCNDQLFVKPTISGKEFIGDYQEGTAYTGAKPSLLIEDKIEDADWLSELILITEKELPMQKKRKKKKVSGINKKDILENICYTELVYERINKKLNTDLSKKQTEECIYKMIKNTNDEFIVKKGKNFYISNSENNIRVTINSNTFRVITANKIGTGCWWISKR